MTRIFATRGWRYAIVGTLCGLALELACSQHDAAEVDTTPVEEAIDTLCAKIAELPCNHEGTDEGDYSCVEDRKRQHHRAVTGLDDCLAELEARERCLARVEWECHSYEEGGVEDPRPVPGACEATAETYLACGRAEPQSCDDCHPANGRPACTTSSCEIESCFAGFEDCDGHVSNGCETEIDRDEEHCGSCDGPRCSDLIANARAVCTQGQCRVSRCHDWYGDCNDDAEDGCETRLVEDPQNCGDCGVECDGTEVCEEGECVSQAGAAREGDAGG